MTIQYQTCFKDGLMKNTQICPSTDALEHSLPDCNDLLHKGTIIKEN